MMVGGGIMYNRKTLGSVVLLRTTWGIFYYVT